MLLAGCDFSFLKTVQVLEVNLIVLFFPNMFFCVSLSLYLVASPLLVGFWLSQNRMVGVAFIW